MKDVHPNAERLVRECIGRLRGRLMYSEQEAIDAIQAVIAKPVRQANNGYIATDANKAAPWKPGDPKPTRVIQTWGKRHG